MTLIVNPSTDDLPTERLCHALLYWRSLSRGTELPRREQFDPLAIPELLPWVNLVDVIWQDDSRRYRHRLIGTKLVGCFRLDSTGKWFDEVYTPAHLTRQLPAYERAVIDAAPNIDLISIVASGDESDDDLAYWRMILPMTMGGERVDLLAVFFDTVTDDPLYGGRLPLHLDSGGREL